MNFTNGGPDHRAANRKYFSNMASTRLLLTRSHSDWISAISAMKV
jgi:hypothetical protein